MLGSVGASVGILAVLLWSADRPFRAAVDVLPTLRVVQWLAWPAAFPAAAARALFAGHAAESLPWLAGLAAGTAFTGWLAYRIALAQALGAGASGEGSAGRPGAVGLGWRGGRLRRAGREGGPVPLPAAAGPGRRLPRPGHHGRRRVEGRAAHPRRGGGGRPRAAALRRGALRPPAPAGLLAERVRLGTGRRARLLPRPDGPRRRSSGPRRSSSTATACCSSSRPRRSWQRSGRAPPRPGRSPGPWSSTRPRRRGSSCPGTWSRSCVPRPHPSPSSAARRSPPSPD